jgi:hypothetical protein
LLSAWTNILAALGRGYWLLSQWFACLWIDAKEEARGSCGFPDVTCGLGLLSPSLKFFGRDFSFF